MSKRRGLPRDDHERTLLHEHVVEIMLNEDLKRLSETLIEEFVSARLRLMTSNVRLAEKRSDHDWYREHLDEKERESKADVASVLSAAMRV